MNLIANIRAIQRARLSARFGARLGTRACFRKPLPMWAERGVAALEFALTLPIWITMLLGVSDGTYSLLVHEKADRIAYTVTDIVTQYQTITKTQLADVVQAAQQLMNPFNFSTNGVVIITSVYKSASVAYPTICWQYTGGGSISRSSKVGASNGATSCTSGAQAVLPNGLTINDNENVVISEVYYQFVPMFLSAGLFTNSDIYRVAVYKPRLSPLITPPT